MAEEGTPEEIVYPRAPLRAVAIEVSFRPLLDAMSTFGKFQRRHVDEFSRLYETSGDDYDPEIPPDGREFMRPRSAVLMARNRERAVSVAKDQLAVITYPYTTGFKGFMTWALPMLAEGLDVLDVQHVRALSYRYENRIEHDTENLDLPSLLNVSLASPRGAESATRSVHLSWRQLHPTGYVHVSVDACPHVSETEIHFNITSTCIPPTGGRNEIEATARTAHNLARQTFEGLITPSFREQLKTPRPAGES